MRAALVLAAALVAAPAWAAPAATPQAGPGSISGVWSMQGYVSSRNPPRTRVARTIDGRIPGMQPWAAELLEKRLSDAEQGRIFANTAAYCLPQGTPYMLFAAVTGPIQILETPGQVTLLSEEFNERWLIYLDQPHAAPGDVEPTFHGDSVAKWDKGDLVVDSVGLTTRTTLDQVGMPHSDALHVITRLHRASADTLEFIVTIDDPKTFTETWQRKVTYRKAPPGERLYEDNCENQRNAPDADGQQTFHLPAAPTP